MDNLHEGDLKSFIVRQRNNLKKRMSNNNFTTTSLASGQVVTFDEKQMKISEVVPTKRKRDEFEQLDDTESNVSRRSARSRNRRNPSRSRSRSPSSSSSTKAVPSNKRQRDDFEQPDDTMLITLGATKQELKTNEERVQKLQHKVSSQKTQLTELRQEKVDHQRLSKKQTKRIVALEKENASLKQQLEERNPPGGGVAPPWWVPRANLSRPR